MTLVPQRTTRQRVLKWFLITLGIITLGIVALVIFVVIQLGGGVKWVFTSGPKATDQHVVALNTAGNTQRDQLVADLQSAGAAAGLTRVTATTPNLGCSEGQHNWKRNDDYDLECSTNVKLILGSGHPSESALRAQLLAFHDQLIAHAWQTAYKTTPLTSIKDIVNQPPISGTPGSRPLLEQSDSAMYFHGKRGGQGSATMSLSFIADQGDSAVRELDRVPYGTSNPEGGTAAGKDVRGYLFGEPERYIVHIALTYVTFYG